MFHIREILTAAAFAVSLAAPLLAGAQPPGDEAASTPTLPASIESNDLRLTFAPPVAGMGLTSVFHKGTQTEFLAAPTTASEAWLWKVELTSDLTTSASFFGLTNRNDSGDNRAWGTTDSLYLQWRQLDLPGEPDALDVTVQIKSRGADGLMEWRIGVGNRSKKNGVFRVIFPVMELRPIGDDGADDNVFVPAMEGVVARRPIQTDPDSRQTFRYWEIATDGAPVMREFPKTKHTIVGAPRSYGLAYPGTRCQMQVMAYYEKQGDVYLPSQTPGPGLYLATHDGAPRPKVFYCQPDAPRGRMTFEVAQYPDKPAEPGANYSSPYPFVTRGFMGDWYDATTIYRQWASRQIWTAKGKLVAREDVPEWLRRVACVLRFDSHKVKGDADLVAQAKLLRERLNGPLMAQWYRWATPARERSYSGGVFPPVAEAPEGFSSVIQQLAEQKIHAMLTVNTLLYRSDRDGYDEALAHAQRRRDGSVAMWEKEGQPPAAVMCEQTPYWRDLLTERARDIASKFGPTAIYLDQLNGARFTGHVTPDGSNERGGCYATEHKHPPGVTVRLVEAQRERVDKMLTAVRVLNPQFVFAGEAMSEIFIDMVPSKIVHHEIWPGGVPAFSRVYHDYATFFGRRIHLTDKDDPDDPLLAMRIGWQLITGTQPGRINSHLATEKNFADPNFMKNFTYLQKVCEAREKLPQFLCVGEMLRPPRIDGDVPRLTTRHFRQSREQVTMSAVLGSTWRAADGAVGVALTNLSDEAIAFEFSLDVAELALVSPPTALRQVFPEAGGDTGGDVKDGRLSRRVTLPGRGVAFYLVDTPSP